MEIGPLPAPGKRKAEEIQSVIGPQPLGPVGPQLPPAKRLMLGDPEHEVVVGPVAPDLVRAPIQQAEVAISAPSTKRDAWMTDLPTDRGLL